MTSPPPSSAHLGPTIAEAITLDHAEAIQALRGLAEVEPVQERLRRFHEVTETLARHEAAEEEVVYPALHRMGDRGRAVRRRRLAEERRAKALVARLTRLSARDPSSEELWTGVRQLAAAVESHAMSEEREVLPLLAAEGNDVRLRAMAVLFRHAEQMAPTRAHPHAPDGLVGMLVGGPPLAVVDRLRDALRRVRRR